MAAIDFPNSPTQGDTFTASNKTWVYLDGKWTLPSVDANGLVTSISSATSGQFLKWNGSAWVNDTIDLGADTAGSFVASLVAGTGVSVTNNSGEAATPTIALDATLDNLSNVTVPSPTANDVLQWNGTAWVNVAASTVGATNLNGLSDVVISTPGEFQTLEYDGTNWVNTYSPVASYVRNAEATTLTTGTVVYLFGATGDHATVKRADNDSDVTSSKTIGVVGVSIPASENGPVITRGYVDGIDLSVGYTAGDILWLGEDGGFTKTKPTAPEHLVFIGVVVRATSNGIIYVATQNGYELDELHDVSITSLASGQFLKYNGSLWVNDAIDLGTDTTGSYVQNLVAGTGVTLTNNSGESATPTVAVDTSVIQARVTDVSDTEIGYLNGVTSAIQTQIDSKAPLASPTFTGTVNTSHLIVGGDLTVSGTTTSINTETVTVDDNIIVLNNNATGAPSVDAGIEVERGSSTNVKLLWNETTDKWQFTNDGSTYTDLGAGGASISDTPPTSPVAGQVWFESDTAKTYVYYDSSWVEIGAGSNPAALNDIGDVTITSATNGQFLKWNGSAWVNKPITTTTTRTNLMANPNFETNTTSWGTISTSGSPTLTRITTDDYIGTASLEVTKGTGRTETLEETAIGTITAGNSYTISGYMKVPTGNETMTAGCRALFFDSSNVQIGSFVAGSTASLTSTSGWVRFSVNTTAPANSSYVRAYFGQTAGGTAGQKFLVDAVLVEQASSALPYFDGTYADTYTGYTLTEQAWNGTADASTSTATWAETSSVFLDDIADVTITSAESGQVLQWNGTAWVNAVGFSGNKQAILGSQIFG